MREETLPHTLRVHPFTDNENESIDPGKQSPSNSNSLGPNLDPKHTLNTFNDILLSQSDSHS